MKRNAPLYAGLLAALLVGTGCGPSTEPAALPPPDTSTTTSDAVADADSGDGQPSGGSGGESKKAGSRGGSGAGDAGMNGDGPSDSNGPSTDGGHADAPAGDGDPGGSGPSPDAGSRPAGGSGPVWPAPGVYTYSQKGFEEFCSGPNCDRQPLPRRQDITTRLTQRGANGAVVVTEIRSEGQLTRTTTRWSRGTALITEVYIRLTYQGFTFEQTYSPSPAVASLRFPLTAGKGWSGTWSGRVSGDYTVSVAGAENVTAAGRSIRAVRLSTRTNFRGEFRGVANATLWLDPRTRALVKTAGNLDVQSNFGRYATGFETALAGGPGY
jgi:hypothetical protein